MRPYRAWILKERKGLSVRLDCNDLRSSLSDLLLLPVYGVPSGEIARVRLYVSLFDRIIYTIEPDQELGIFCPLSKVDISWELQVTVIS